MTQTLWNPWSKKNNVLFEQWLKAAMLSGVVAEKEFLYEDLVPIVDNAETLGLTDDLSRDQAMLLAGLWMGRYQGNQDTGEWVERPIRGESDLERAMSAAKDFLDQAARGTSQEFWAATARLITALGHLHPENQ